MTRRIGRYVFALMVTVDGGPTGSVCEIYDTPGPLLPCRWVGISLVRPTPGSPLSRAGFDRIVPPRPGCPDVAQSVDAAVEVLLAARLSSSCPLTTTLPPSIHPSLCLSFPSLFAFAASLSVLLGLPYFCWASIFFAWLILSLLGLIVAGLVLSLLGLIFAGFICAGLIFAGLYLCWAFSLLCLSLLGLVFLCWTLSLLGSIVAGLIFAGLRWLGLPLLLLWN